MSSPIKNLAIIGASGNVGSQTVKALLASSNPPVITAITREDSDAKFDSRLKVVKGNHPHHHLAVPISTNISPQVLKTTRLFSPLLSPTRTPSSSP